MIAVTSDDRVQSQPTGTVIVERPNPVTRPVFTFVPDETLEPLVQATWSRSPYYYDESGLKPVRFFNGESTKLTISNLPKHVWYDITVNFGAGDDDTFSFTVSNGSHSETVNHSKVLHMYINDDGMDAYIGGSTTFTISGIVGDPNGPDQSWTISYGQVRVLVGDLGVGPEGSPGQTFGGTNYWHAHLTVDNLPAEGDTIHLGTLDRSILEPVDAGLQTLQSLPTDTNGNIRFLVYAKSYCDVDTSIYATDNSGVRASYGVPVWGPLVNGGVGHEGIHDAGFTYNVLPSETPITFHVTYARSTAIDGLDFAPSSQDTVTIPAHASSYFDAIDQPDDFVMQPNAYAVVDVLGLDYSPQHYAHDEAAEQLLDNDQPTVLINGATSGSQIQLDTEGDPTKLADVEIGADRHGDLTQARLEWSKQIHLWSSPKMDPGTELDTMPEAYGDGANQLQGIDLLAAFGQDIPKHLYAQAIDGSPFVDGTAIYFVMAIMSPLSATVPTTEKDGNAQGTGTAEGFWLHSQIWDGNNTHHQSGGINEKLGDILIGQRAAVEIYYDGPRANDGDDGTFNWSVGGDITRDWSAGSNSAYYDDPLPSEFHDFRLIFHWDLPGKAGTSRPETASCSGTWHGLSFNLSGIFNVWTPNSKLDVQLRATKIGLNNVDGSTQLSMALTSGAAVPGPGQGQNGNTINGIDFTGEVDLPSGMGTGGSWDAFQLNTVDRHKETFAGAKSHSKANGKKGLDKNFPYGSDTFTPVGQEHIWGDNPATGLVDPLSGNYYKKASVNERYEMHIMYLPPGDFAIWVPLKVSAWWWRTTAVNNGTATLPNFSVDWTPPGSAGANTGVTVGKRTTWDYNTYPDVTVFQPG